MLNTPNHYGQTGSLRPGKTAFDLSHNKLFDMDIGKLVPVLCEEVLPGDVIEYGNNLLIRAQALVAPIYHKLQAYIHLFFVPNRIIFKDWEKFITKGVTGNDSTNLPQIFENTITAEGNVNVSRYGLWDSLSLPMHDPATGVPENTSTFNVQPPVIDFPWRAYWAIWREYYRDENIQTTYPDGSTDIGQDEDDKISGLNTFMDAYTGTTTAIPTCDQLAYRCFEKDYFTSALPYQQLGTAPIIPISGTTAAAWLSSAFEDTSTGTPVNVTASTTPGTTKLGFSGSSAANGNINSMFNNNTVSFTATGVDVAELRLVLQTQRFMERNMRGGYRYDEFLQMHFDERPQDYRANKPTYIGGTSSPIVISEVLQTSATDTGASSQTPQGNMSGHGMAASTGFGGKFRAREHGQLMAIMSILPSNLYQQGIPRQLSKTTALDYYSPEFQNLSEQEILKQELYYSRDTSTTDTTRFAWQAAWDEYRTRRSTVSGKLASDLKYWHLSRIFSSAPSLNEAFLTTEQLSQNRRTAWAVTDVENGTLGQFIVQLRNIVKMIRPLPYISIPSISERI